MLEGGGGRSGRSGGGGGERSDRSGQERERRRYRKWLLEGKGRRGRVVMRGKMGREKNEKRKRDLIFYAGSKLKMWDSLFST